MFVYTITDGLSIFAILIVFIFAMKGLIQLIKRRSLFKVDLSIILLGAFYILVMSAYVFFEFFIVNYRPVLIEGKLEASYPSSTTMLVMCVFPMAMILFHRMIENNCVRVIVNVLLGVFTTGMVVGRLVSGVHWFTNIIGGILLSSALVMLFYSVNDALTRKGN